MNSSLNITANEWPLVTLDDVCERRIEQRNPRREPEQPFVYVDISSVNNATKRIESPKHLLGREAPSRARQILKNGDVLVATTRPNLNAVAMVPPELDGQVASTGFCVLRSTSQVDGGFLFLFVQTQGFVRNLSEAVKGALYPAVTDSQARAQKLFLPPVSAQRRIADRLHEQLAEVGRARAAIKARLVAAQELPSTLLHTILERGSAEAWKRCRLGDVLAGIQAGKCVACEERPARISEWGVLKVSAVTWGEFRASENKVLPPGYHVPAHAEVRPGDLLISRSNTTELVGAVVLVRETRPRLMLSDKTLRLIPRQDSVPPEFLEYALRGAESRRFIELNATGTSSSMKNITQDTIRAVPLSLPPVEEQRRIADHLSALHSAIRYFRSKLVAQLEATEMLPAALLREAFKPFNHHPLP